MSCEKCQHLAVRPNGAGDRVVYKARSYECKAPIETPALPESITRLTGFHWPPNRSAMTKGDGVNCPLFLKLQPRKS